MSIYNKKTYNVNPAKYSITLSQSRRSYLTKDKVRCEEKGFDALDFVLWYDQTLLDADISFAQSPFNFILQCVEKKIITARGIDNDFRLACLIFSVFVNSEVSPLKRIRQTFLNENPNFFENERNTAYRTVDFNSVYNYNRSAANKKMFPFFDNKGIEKRLISELISRQLLAFDDKGTYKNIVYVCQDVLGNKQGLEICGMTSNPFMRLLGKPFPFLYFRDETEQLNNADFERVEVFADTLTMLKRLSELYVTPDGIPFRVLYISLHKSNYSEEAYKNFAAMFREIEEVWHCDCKRAAQPKEAVTISPVVEETVRRIPQTATAYNPDKKFSDLSVPVSKEFVPLSVEQLIEMKKNNKLTDKIFAVGNRENYASEYTFEEIIEMPQKQYTNDTICFVNEDGEEYDILGYTLLPF